MSTKLGRGEYAETLRRYFQLAGGEIAGQHVSPDIVPIWEIEPPRASHRYLLREKLLGGQCSIAAGTAGQIWQLVINNPAASKIIAEFERFSIGNAAVSAQTFYLAPAGAPVAGGAGIGTMGVARDGRWQQQPTTGSLFTSALTFNQLSAAVGSGSPAWFLGAAAGATVETSVPFVLVPGHALVIRAANTDIAFLLAAQWTERESRPYEKGW